MTDHNIVRMVHAIEERISGGGAADINSGGGVQASVDGTFLADVYSTAGADSICWHLHQPSIDGSGIGWW